jgi:ribose-phosphate pyrophosphokinase
VLVDDIASSGHTLVEAASEIVRMGLPRPACAVVHALCTGESEAALRAATEAFVSTDTVAHSSNALSVAGLLAEAVA